MVHFQMEWTDVISHSLKQQYLFLGKFFPSTSNSYKCIISSCLHTIRAAQTRICDNLWNFESQRRAWPQPMMMSSVIYVTLKGQLFSPADLVIQWPSFFTTHQNSAIIPLTYGVTLAWKIRSAYYSVFRTWRNCKQEYRPSAAVPFENKQCLPGNSGQEGADSQKSVCASRLFLSGSEIISTW